MNESEYRVGMDFVKEHFYYVYPKNEKPSQEYINRLFSELIAKYGISGCIIDPFNQLDHHLRMSSRDDLYISDFLTEEKKFAIDNDVYKVIIAHPNKMQKNESGNYTCPDVFDFNGGSIWGAKVDNVLQTYRPNYSTDPSNTEVHFISQKIKKQKLIGIPGTVTLHYNRDSGRYFDCYGYNPLDNIHKSTQTDMKLQTEDPFSNLHPNDDSNPF
jgi:twinkle protein